MKRSLFGLALVLLVALVAGCANSARQPYLASTMQRSKSFALAVTVHGGLQPTPMQWAAIQAKFADEFSWRGWVLVTDLALADYIVRVDFTPDAIDPENAGTVAVLGIRNNPRNVLASTTSLSGYPTSFGYAGSFQNALWGSGFSGMYYGWNDSYYDGYSYSSPTLNPVKPPTVTTHPPYRHHKPGDTAWCPPDRSNLPPHNHNHNRPPSFLPGDFAAPLPPTTAPAPMIASSERSHRWSDSHRSSSDGNASSGITYSRGGSNTSSSDRTYARGDSSGSRDWSSWRDRSSQSGSSYSRSDYGSSYPGSDSSSSHSSWSGSSSRADSGSSYSRSGSDWSHSHSSSDSSYSRGGSSSSSSWSGSSHSSGSSYSGSSNSSGSSSAPSSSSSSGGSSSSSSGSSSSTGSPSSNNAQQN